MFARIGFAVFLLWPGMAMAAPTPSHSTKVWQSLEECWASVYPTVLVLGEDFGLAKMVENSPDKTAFEIIALPPGRPLMRLACVRIPGKVPALYRREIEAL